MFTDLRLRDFVTVLFIVLITTIAIHFYVDNKARNQLWLKTYPIRGYLSQSNLSCSTGSPAWLKDVLINQIKYANAPSNQIAYIDSTGKLHHCENGYTDQYPLLSGGVTKDTRFRYASVTKLWTSDAILDLVKQDRLSLDTKLSHILTEIDNPEDSRISDITIEQLLTHRAGFNRYSTFGQDMFGIGKDICPNHLNELNSIELYYTPGEVFSYSNLGYCLLGEVVARLEGRLYTDVIIAKYGLSNTGIQFIDKQKMPDEVFYNHVETGLTGVADIYTAFDYEGLASAAGLSGSAIGLAKQIRVMAEKPAPDILSYNKKDCDLSKLRDCYGYAMFGYQAKEGDLVVYFRDGGLLGLSSLVVVSEQGEVVALLSNGTPENGEEGNDRTKRLIYLGVQTE